MNNPIIPQVFDPQQRRRARTRAFRDCPDDTRFLHAWADGQLKSRLQDIKRDFTNPLFLGPDSLASGMHDEILNTSPSAHDLILTNSWLHTMNDLTGILIQIRQTLRPDGLFMAAMLGGETLHELRYCLQQAEMELTGGASPRVAPFADKQQMGALMQRAGYALPVIDSDLITVTYPDLKKLMLDLRGMGETNMVEARSRKIPPRLLFTRAEDIYRQLFSEEDGRLIATFEIIFLLGWAPHESQQKPLSPGSAQIRLADALDAGETKLPQ